MSVASGPKVVTDGLVFSFDTHNNRSWKGAPTINLIANAGSDAEVEKTGAAPLYAYYTVNITSDVLAKWTASNNKLSMSFEGKRDYVQGGTGGGGDGYPVMYIYFSDWTWSASLGITTYDWSYNALNNITMPDPTGKAIYFSIYHMNSGNPGKSYSRKHQVEFGTFATPFVNGTRSNVQSLVDLTSNRAVLTDSLTYNNDGTFKFNSANSNYASITPVTLTNSSYTVEAFIKRDSINATHGILSDLQYSWWTFFVDSSNKIAMYHARNNGYAVNSVAGATTIGTNWTHVAAVFDTNTGLSVYVNGQLDGSNTNTVVFDLSAGRGPQYIGLSKTDASTVLTNPFNGFISNIKLYNRALTSQEIWLNFNASRGRYGI